MAPTTTEQPKSDPKIIQKEKKRARIHRNRIHIKTFCERERDALLQDYMVRLQEEIAHLKQLEKDKKENKLAKDIETSRREIEHLKILTKKLKHALTISVSPATSD